MGGRDVVITQDAVDGDGDGEDGGLRVLRLLELLGGSVEAELREGETEGVVSFFESLSGNGEVLGEGEVERSLGERRIKRSPLRDVAGLVLSLYSAAHNSLYGRVPGTAYADVEARVLRPIAATWYRWAAAEFLRGYLAVKGIAELLPVAQSDVVGLLDVLMLEQALREIARDAADRPEHIHVSIRAVLHLLNAEDKA